VTRPGYPPWLDGKRGGLYDAKLDHAPVLTITRMPETSVLGTGYQQEVNLFKDRISHLLA
jgi:thiamine pyrophosphate-dependent acetolactate synthase large subunit-like protein